MLTAEYDKKKYVWKLLYIYMLGYPVEFGHKQASDLIAAPKYVIALHPPTSGLHTHVLQPFFIHAERAL